MADQKLTELGAITAVSGDELIYIVDDPSTTPVSNKVALKDLINYLSAQLIIMEEVFS